MPEYSIPVLIIKGVSYKSDVELNLNGIVEFGRHLNSKGLIFTIYKKVGENQYEHPTLSELELLLKAQDHK